MTPDRSIIDTINLKRNSFFLEVKVSSKSLQVKRTESGKHAIKNSVETENCYISNETLLQQNVCCFNNTIFWVSPCVIKCTSFVENNEFVLTFFSVKLTYIVLDGI